MSNEHNRNGKNNHAPKPITFTRVSSHNGHTLGVIETDTLPDLDIGSDPEHTNTPTHFLYWKTDNPTETQTPFLTIDTLVTNPDESHPETFLEQQKDAIYLFTENPHLLIGENPAAETLHRYNETLTFMLDQLYTAESNLYKTFTPATLNLAETILAFELYDNLEDWNTRNAFLVSMLDNLHLTADSIDTPHLDDEPETDCDEMTDDFMDYLTTLPPNTIRTVTLTPNHPASTPIILHMRQDAPTVDNPANLQDDDDDEWYDDDWDNDKDDNPEGEPEWGDWDEEDRAAFFNLPHENLTPNLDDAHENVYTPETVGDEQLFTTALHYALHHGGGLIIRDTTPAASTVTDTAAVTNVYGYSLGGNRILPLPEADMFDAHCIDNATGEPIPPEFGVTYITAPDPTGR